MYSLRLNPLRCLVTSRRSVALMMGVLGVSSIACGSADTADDADQGALTNQTTTLGDGHVCTDAASLGAPLPCPLSRGVPETNILPELLDNGNLFASPFYDKHPAHHRGAEPGDANGGVPLKLTEEISKNYYFPTRYRDVTTAVAMFFCDYQKAKALMPHPEIEPVDMGLGRSLVVITSYRYNRVYGINPYNEIAIAIPAVAGRLLNPPVIPLLISDWKGLGFYVQSMPVTTLENNIRGHELWGLPKVLQEIDLQVKGNDYVTSVKDEQGEVYLEFKVPMNGEALHVDAQSYIYSKLNDVTYRAPSNTAGDFTTTKWMTRLAEPLSALAKDDGEHLKIGRSAAAATLRDLEIAPSPFQVRFAKGTESVFDLPDGQLDERGKAQAPASYGPR